MNTKTQTNRGQIVVIFAVALIVLLGFTALAIDGGMIYSDRRYDQSVADASSLAGGGAAAKTLDDNGVTYVDFTCSLGGVAAARTAAVNAAISRAVSNNFPDIDADISDNHGVITECVNDPDKFDRHIDVRTGVTSETSTSFAQLFTNGAFVNQVDAVVRVRPRTEFAFGNAIVALSPDCPNSNTGGVRFDGNSDVQIDGGGVFSNACITAGGTSLSIDVDDGNIGYFTTYTPSGTPTVNPTPEQAPAQIPDYGITPPICPTTPAISHNGAGTIDPGNYSRIKLNNGDLIMNPGLYCLSGNFSITGGHLIGEGVTIFFKDGSFEYSTSGNPEVDLIAPTDANLVGNAIPGVVVYFLPSLSVSLLGNGDSIYQGIIYAPNGMVEVGGTSGVNPTFNTQIVGYTVKVHGNATININYDNNIPYTWSPKLDVYR